MHLPGWLFGAIWAASALLALSSRRWKDALASACFATFLLLDAFIPELQWQLKVPFAVLGMALVATEVAKNYRR